MATPSDSRSRRRREVAVVSVRPASLADIDVIVRFRMELLKEHAGHPIYGRVREDAATRARRSTALHLASGREITYIALDGREPIGMLRCMESRGSPLLLPTRYAYITSVFVARSHRRQGILRKLIEGAVTWSRARGLGELRLHATPDNTVAAAAWDKLGFPPVEYLRRKEINRTPSA